MQIVHMQPLVSSLSASDRLVQPLRKGPSLADAQDGHLQREMIPDAAHVVFVMDLLTMSGLRSKHVEEFNLM